jgi:cytochrome P450
MAKGPWSIIQAMRFAKEPDSFFRDLRQSQGDPFYLKLPAIGEIVCSAKAEAAQEVFALPTEVLSAVPGNPVEPLLGTKSLILQEGAVHRRQRKLIGPAFAGDRVRAYGEIFQAATEEALGDLTVPGEFDAHALTSAVALDIILRAVFGVTGNRRRVFRDAISAVSAASSFALLLIPKLRQDLWGLSPWRGFCRARDAFNALLMEQIEERRSEDVERQDVLSKLMRARDEDGQPFSDEELLDQLRTLLIAGHETTAITVAWGLYYVHENPAIGDRLRTELTQLGPAPDAVQLASAKYLQATCNEALRLHPPVPFVGRTVNKAIPFCGIDLAPGTNVGIAVGLLHENEETFPDPLRFVPERFLDKKYSPNEFAPYGGGIRRCVGAPFGDLEVKVILGALLTRARCELLTTANPRRAMKGITMAPNHPIKFKLLERRATPAAEATVA